MVGKRYPGAVLGVVLALVLAVTGCGSSDSSGDTTHGLTGEPIKVGTIGTFSGVTAQSHADAPYAIKAWANAVNANGGIDGRPVEVIVADDKGDPAAGATAVKKMVETDDVVAIVGEHSVSAAGWAPYALEKNIPVVGGYANAPEMVGYPNWFSTGGNIVASFWAIANEAAKSGDKIAMLYCAEAPACKAASTILGQFGDAVGVDLAYAGAVAGDSSDYSAVCMAMKDAGVSSYNMSVASAVTDRIGEQCQKLGFNAQLIQVAEAANNLRETSPVYNGAKFVGTNPGFFVDSSPAAKEFQAAMKEYAPEVGTSEVPMNSSSIDTWIAGKLFEAAVAASGSKDVTTDTVFNGLYALDGETLGGLAPALTYTKGQPSLFNVYFPFQLQDGQWLTPDGTDPVAADAAVSAQIAEIAKGFAPK